MGRVGGGGGGGGGCGVRGHISSISDSALSFPFHSAVSISLFPLTY